MVIEKNRVIFENANIPHSYGELNPSNFTPYPKNPNIAKVFREIGFEDELGSGVKNLYKYSKTYGGRQDLHTRGFWGVSFVCSYYSYIWEYRKWSV